MKKSIKLSDNFVYAITKYVSLPLTLITFTNYYCHQIASNPYIHHPSQTTIVISSSMQKTGFQTVKFLPGILLTLTLILSSTFLSSKATVISNSSFQKIMAPTYCSRRLHRCSLALSIGTRLRVSAHSAYRKRFALERALTNNISHTHSRTLTMLV